MFFTTKDGLFSNRLFSHALFWLITVIVLSYHGSLFGGSFSENLIEMLCMLPAKMLAAYFLVYYQIPKLLFQKKWITFGLSFLVSAYILSTLARLAIIHVAEPLMNYEKYDESLLEILSDPIYLAKVYVISVYLPSFLLLVLKFTKDRFYQENQMITLEKEKKNAELSFLKAQMNPHFLFNTLNNIYALTKNKSDEAPEMIMKLSEILDYTIYECNETKVPIAREWDLIENYVDLQSTRFSEALLMTLEKNIDDEKCEIAPLILISLVENAFKHTLISDEKQPTIKVSLVVQNSILDFVVCNSKSDTASKSAAKKKGIGVENVKRQLKLLYQDQYNLSVVEDISSYKVKLTINL